MNRDRISFIAGFMPAAAMAMLMGAERILQGGAEAGGIALALGGIVPFAIPYAILLFLSRLPKEPVRLRIKGFTRHGVAFVLCMSVTAALLSFLLNSLFAHLFGLPVTGQMAGRQIMEQSPLWLSLLMIAIIPAVMEELLFRSGILGCFESNGTFAALLVSALTFALIHGNPSNLLGPFAAGLIYGYLCYVLDSVWPAIIAHLVNNVYYMGMSYATSAYESLGIWPYLMMILVLVFAFFLYLSMRCLEKLIEKGKVPRLQWLSFAQTAAGVAASPGLWLLGLMFLFKVLYQTFV